MIRTIGNIIFFLAAATGVISALAFFNQATPNPVLFTVSVWSFIVGFLASTAERGNKTALQKIFFSLGALALICTIHFSLGAIGWIGVGICAFLVLTMKLDGGD